MAKVENSAPSAPAASPARVSDPAKPVKVNLPKAYMYAGKIYGPGEVEISEPALSSIRRKAGV